MKLYERVKLSWKILVGKIQLTEDEKPKNEAIVEGTSHINLNISPIINSIISTSVKEEKGIPKEIVEEKKEVFTPKPEKYNTFDLFLQKLRDFQLKAFNEIQNHSIGQIFIPTGTGKTWIQKAVHVYDMIIKTSKNQTGTYVIGAHRLLLCEQLLDEIVELANNFNINFRIMFVGSSDYKPKINNIEYLPSLDKNKIDDFIQSSKSQNYHTIIAITYHSFSLLKGIPIDICTFDEAHNTVSDDDDPKMFRRNIEEVKPFIKRQYFFTASPKSIGEFGGQRDQQFYGPILYELSPKEAVEKLEIVQPKLHTVDIVGSYDDKDVNHNDKLDIKTVIETFTEHEKVLKVAAKLLVTGKNLDQIHKVYENSSFQYWCKSNNVTCFIFSSRIGRHVDFNTSIDCEEKLKQLKLDLNQRAIFLHFDILSEGIDIPNMTGCLFFRHLETNEIKFIQNIGRCSRLVLEDRLKIYRGEIKSLDDPNMKKPESWIIIPLYSSDKLTEERYKKILKRLRETYNIPFIDVRMSRLVTGNPERISIPGIKIITEDGEKKDFVLKHDFEATIIKIIKEELEEQLDQATDKEELISSWIDDTFGPDNLYIEGLKHRLKEYEYFTRHPEARIKCLNKYGYKCFVCGKKLEDTYGDDRKNLIEVHHEKQICKGYRVTDPENDLKPVCPDCHTIIHSRRNMYSIEEVQKMIEETKR